MVQPRELQQALRPRELSGRMGAVARNAWAARRTSVRIGISFVTPLAVATALGHTYEGAVATGGAWAALYARDDPYRRRLVVMSSISLALVAVIALGTIAAAAPWAVAVGAGWVAGVGSLAAAAWNVGRPREFFLVLAFLAATQLPGGTAALPERVALVLGGSATVIALAMVGWLRRPRGPEERALELSWRRLAELLEALGTPAAADARSDLLHAVQHLRDTFAGTGHARGDGDRLFAMAVAGENVADAALGLVLRDCPKIDIRWVIAARRLESAVREPEAAPRGVNFPTPRSVHGDRFARMMEQAVLEANPLFALSTTLVPFTRRARRGPFAKLRQAAHPGSVILPTALRTGIAVAIGTALGLAIDDQRGIWVGLTTAAVLLASNVSHTARRTVQRATGTILGAGLAAAIFLLHPGPWAIVAVLLVLQVLMQSTLFTAYGVATFFSTPIALLIVDLGLPGTPPGSLLGPRIVDTLLGCAVALLARRLLWPRNAAKRLGVAQAAAVIAARDVLHAAMTRSETPSSILVRRTRRELHDALLSLSATQGDAVGDLLLSSRAADDRFTVTTAVERLAFAVMGFAAPRDHAPEGREHLDELEEALTQLAAIAYGSRAPSPAVAIPPIVGHPATHAALLGLREALHAADEGEASDPDRSAVTGEHRTVPRPGRSGSTTSSFPAVG